MTDAGRAARTVQYALTVVRQVYNFAILHDLYDGTNPVSKIRMPKVDNKRLRFLSHEEADRLLEALARRSVRLYEMSLISLNCGLRAGEIHALKWADLDLRRGTVSVLDGKGWNRVVPMPRAVIEMLSAKDRTNPDDLIFPSRKGNQKVWVSRTFARVVNELGFNEGISDRRHRVSFHSIRHTYASWLVAEGVDLYTVSKLMGHSSITMTERYSHLAPDGLRAAVKVLEREPKAGAMVVNLEDRERWGREMSAQELKVLHQPDEYALIEISALMAYPSEADEEKRRGLALRMLLTLATDQYVDLRKEHGEREPELSKHIGSWLGEVVLFHGGWPALANCTVGPGQKKSISDELWDRYKKGRTIGAVLGFALTRDLSIKAASELVCGDEMISIAKDILDTEPPYYDPRSIRHLWPTFKPVAHYGRLFSSAE